MAFTNKLSGEIPDFWDNFPNLGVLQLYGNPGITGPIPPSIGTLKKATGIQLKECNLTGNIPASFAGLDKCGNLQLNGNKLKGVIPESQAVLKASNQGIPVILDDQSEDLSQRNEGSVALDLADVFSRIASGRLKAAEHSLIDDALF